MATKSEVVASIASGDSHISLWDIETGTTVHSLHSTKVASPAGVACAPVAGLGVTVFAVAQSDRPAIFLYNAALDQPTHRCPLAERIQSVALNSDASLLAAGGVSGKLYIWVLATGELRIIDGAHYKPIISLSFGAADDCWLLSAGEDAVVHVWDLMAIISRSAERVGGSNRPLLSLSGHSLPVTSIITRPSWSRCYTCSLDRTVKCWDLRTGLQLFSILLPSPLTSMAVDSTESIIYAGSSDGSIYPISIYPFRSRVLPSSSSSSSSSAEQQHTVDAALTGHSSVISSLLLTSDGSRLISSSHDGSCRVWETSSKNCLRVVTIHSSGPVVAATLIRDPRAAFLRTHPFAKQAFSGLVQPLKKFQGAISSASSAHASSSDPTVISSELQSALPILAADQWPELEDDLMTCRSFERAMPPAVDSFASMVGGNGGAASESSSGSAPSRTSSASSSSLALPPPSRSFSSRSSHAASSSSSSRTLSINSQQRVHTAFSRLAMLDESMRANKEAAAPAVSDKELAEQLKQAQAENEKFKKLNSELFAIAKKQAEELASRRK